MGEQIFQFIVQFLIIIYRIYFFLIFAEVIFSWIRPQPNRLTEFVHDVTKPFLDLARKVTPKLGMIDISPIIAFIGIELIFKLLLLGLGLIEPYIIAL